MEHTTPISDKLEREIEAGTRDVPQRVWHQMHAFERDLAALKAQRDELLAGLERIGRIGGTDGAEDGRLVEYDGAWASVTARALIAKHKGVSHE